MLQCIGMLSFGKQRGEWGVFYEALCCHHDSETTY